MDYITHYASPLGGITLASDGEALVGLWFDGQKHFASCLDPLHETRSSLSVFDETRRWLDLYFEGTSPNFTPTLAMRGTPFQIQVYEILRSIPYGHTMTYGEIARAIALQRGRANMSAQAVGAAVGRNPISIIIPCHRVVGTHGALTGYAGGIDKKEWLLQWEKMITFAP